LIWFQEAMAASTLSGTATDDNEKTWSFAEKQELPQNPHGEDSTRYLSHLPR